MTHLRPEEKSAKRRKSDCRKGLHAYGATQSIGAGIDRRVCQLCNTVTIDLTSTYEPGRPSRPRTAVGSPSDS
jgi:hypothetical protein